MGVYIYGTVYDKFFLEDSFHANYLKTNMVARHHRGEDGEGRVMLCVGWHLPFFLGGGVISFETKKPHIATTCRCFFFYLSYNSESVNMKKGHEKQAKFDESSL